MLELSELIEILDEGASVSANTQQQVADELRRLRKIEDAAKALANYVARSTDVGPITRGPHKEAILWRGLRDALGETWE